MSLKMKKHPSRGRNKDSIAMRCYIKDKKEIGYELPDLNTHKIKYNQAMIKKSDEVIDVYEVAYWRKANAIHKWFVDNVQKGKDDCKEYRVTRRNLLDLCDLVSDVLDHCELKEGKVRNGYQLKKFLWFHYKKYNKVLELSLEAPFVEELNEDYQLAIELLCKALGYKFDINGNIQSKEE